MERLKVYIYGLYDKDDVLFYVGKSSSPQNRLYHHKSRNAYSDTIKYMKILDMFYDKEQDWLNKFLQEGVKLVNKQQVIIQEEVKVGEIITANTVHKVKVMNTETQRIYSSIREAYREMENIVNYQVFKYWIHNPNAKRINKYKELKFPYIKVE